MDEITAIIVTSVLKSHPSLHILEETYNSIRHHLPHSDIIIQIDGLRDEQQDRKEDYDEYKNQVLWKCLHEWKNTLPIVFDEHSHQSTMMKETLNYIKTPYILYIEGDAPLVTDHDINWVECLEKMESGEAYTIRFHFEAQIPEPHKHLMLDDVENGFLKTIQWSQRPMLSSVAYYKNVVLPNVPDKSFIEDTFHGTVQNDYYEDGMHGWYKHRLWIYHPEGSIKRSYHLDGRAGGRKFTSDDEAWGLI